jgi:hypothetical protein
VNSTAPGSGTGVNVNTSDCGPPALPWTVTKVDGTEENNPLSVNRLLTSVLG